MNKETKFTHAQVNLYWILIAAAPFSILTAATHVPPIFVWLFFALGIVASLNRVRHSKSKLAVRIAAITATLYSGLLLTLAYMYAQRFFT